MNKSNIAVAAEKMRSSIRGQEQATRELHRAIVKAKELNCTVAAIAEAAKMTRQGVYYILEREGYEA